MVLRQDGKENPVGTGLGAVRKQISIYSSIARGIELDRGLLYTIDNTLPKAYINFGD
jgi:hypothetical protein